MLFNAGRHYFNHYSANQVKWYKWSILLVMFAGAFLRIYHFLDNRSLWEDEVYLSSGIINLSFSGLIKGVLPYLQKAPLGYLLIAKACVCLFGKNEMALRLYPLICALVSLVLFLKICQNFLKPLGVIVAMVIFAFAPPLVYHAVEAKPYGTELLATLVILWWFIRYQQETNLKHLIIFGLYGAVIVWFAFTAIFILSGVTLAICLTRVRKHEWKAVFIMAIPVTMWVISFGANYFLFARQGSNSGWLVDFWTRHDGYMPLSPVAAVKWFAHALIVFFHYPLGLSWFNDWTVKGTVIQFIKRMAFVPLIPLAIGIRYLYKENQRLLLLILSSTFVALVASAVRQYPFHERLTVYLAPLVIILLAAGCQASFWRSKAWLKPALYVLIVLLLFGPVYNSVLQAAVTHLFGDYKKSYQREALSFMKLQDNSFTDTVYVYWNDLPGFDLYNSMYPVDYKIIRGHDFRRQAHNFVEYFKLIDRDMATVKSKRFVWVIFNEHIDIPVGDYIGDPAWYYEHNDGIKRFKEYLHKHGRELFHFYPEGSKAGSDVNVTLWEFSK